MQKHPWEYHTIGIIGYGNMGKLICQLIRRFSVSMAVKVFEKDMAADGVTFFSFGQIVRCDVIVFAVPMVAFENTLRDVLGAKGLRKSTVLVEICTDKMKSAQLLASQKRNPYISCHPMWGPQAYKNSGGDIRGFPIVVVGERLYTLAPKTFTKLRTYLTGLGFKVATMSARQHDERVVATELYVTHLLSLILKRANLIGNGKISTVAPQSYRDVRRGLESVMEDEELFRQLWRRVPACQNVFDRIFASMMEIHEEQKARM